MEALMGAARARRVAGGFAGVALFAATLATLGFACSSSTKQAPGLEVVVSSDLRFGVDYDVVEIKVSQQGTDGVFGAALLDTAMAVSLPTSVTVLPGPRPDPVARIVAKALKGLNTVVTVTAQVPVPTTDLEELQMFLGADCENVPCSLVDTCLGGTCQSFVVDPSKLKPYDPNDLLPGTPDATVSSTPPDASSSEGGSCAAQCLLSGGCYVIGGSPCCVASGGTCPSGAKCAGGFCGAAPADAGPAESGSPETGAPDARPGDAATQCGQPGEACCLTNVPCTNLSCPTSLGAGCTCVGPGGTCPIGGSSGICTNGQCIPTSCGTAGGGCCPGNTCMAGSVCARPPPPIDGGYSCVGCGMSHQLCCPPDSGVPKECQAGTCSGGQCP